MSGPIHFFLLAWQAVIMSAFQRALYNSTVTSSPFNYPLLGRMPAQLPPQQIQVPNPHTKEILRQYKIASVACSLTRCPFPFSSKLGPLLGLHDVRYLIASSYLFLALVSSSVTRCSISFVLISGVFFVYPMLQS